MLTGTVLINELVDELNELKLSTMAATLDDLYHKPGFLEMDRLTLIAELIGPQFQEKVSTTLKNRLTAAHLKGSPEELSDCVDSDKREYLPAGITEVLSSFDFIERGYCTGTLIFSITTTSYSEAVVNIGYNELNFTLASAVRNCQLTFAATVLRSTSHAANSPRSFAMFSILRDKHCLVITFSSISAMSSQLPCLGV